MLSGQEFPIDDWSTRDPEIAALVDKNFTQLEFHSYPSLRSKHPVDGWTESRPYHGEPFDEADWTLKAGGWDHEHCFLCYATIKDGMTYWANAGEVRILCDYCHDHYGTQLTNSHT